LDFWVERGAGVVDNTPDCVSDDNMDKAVRGSICGGGMG
jgi:hypothetical protein